MSIPIITVVHTPGCHYCADARDVLAVLGQDVPVRVELVEADGTVGRTLVGTHRPAMFPLVLIDGAFFSQGRLPRRKLRAHLGARSPVSPR